MITLRIASAVAARLLRSRLLIVAVLFGIVLVIMMAAPIFTIMELKEGGEFVDAQGIKAMCMPAAIAVMGSMSNLIALLLGSTVVRQDIKDGTIFSVLSKPISRLQYFIGSVLGAIYCQCSVWLVFGAIWLGFSYLVEKSIQPLHGYILCSEVVKSILMLSLALAWSQKFSPWIAGALALCTFDGADLSERALTSLRYLHVFPGKTVMEICAFPFPKFMGFDALLHQISETSLAPVSVTWSFIHMFDYLAFALLVAWLCFRKMDLISSS
jgi:ABC-type transport system involved in multi-copper enzyme maturation permease subunit